MVQEFHVLRCFACETFQVQQVKKAKKWNCKICGEKQSVIKEYGRGSGADCRRHVQKLNSLRGQLLEEENENAWALWEEDDGCEYNQEDPTVSCEPHQNIGESRWSKYTEKTAIPNIEDEEEENVYTERKRFTSQKNLRKRKRDRGARRSFGGRDEGKDEEEEEEDQHFGAGAWRHNKGGIKPLTHTRLANPSAPWEDHTFSIPSFHSNSPKPATASKPLPSEVPSRNFRGSQQKSSLSTEPSQSRPTGPVATNRSLENVSINEKTDESSPSGNQSETRSSKWSRFLTLNEDQEDTHLTDADEALDLPVSVSCSNIGFPTGFENQDNFKAKPEKTSGGLSGPLPGLASCSGVVQKIKSATACFGFVSASNQMASPAFTNQSIFKGKPVCHQPPPAKRPCSGLAVTSLFQTDEDFDDAF